jgi:hypothetical protein
MALLPALTSAPTAAAYEGYGYKTVGGKGGSTCRVTTLAATGPGSFASCVVNRTGPRVVVFGVGGTITLSAPVRVRTPYLTIDGTTAPSPGITIRPPYYGAADALYIEATHDVVVKGLRFVGYGHDGSGGDLVSVYGRPRPCYNIVVDHCTFARADDGALDITSDGHDMTVSWCLFRDNSKTQLVKYGVLSRISVHHNVYASSVPKGERDPLLWGDVTDFDFVNNVVYNWFGYGTGIRHEGDGGQPGKRVRANLVGNAFWHQQQATVEDALVYGRSPGRDAEDGGPPGTPVQGKVVSGTRMGRLWVSGNVLPPRNRDHYSTVSAPLPVPTAARVTRWPAAQLSSKVLPTVGTVFRSAAERTLLTTLARVTAPDAAPSDFFTVQPCRALDTRVAGAYGGALVAGTSRVVTLAGRCGVPASARAVALNVTATEATAAGNLRVFPADLDTPSTSTVNYEQAETRASNAVIGLSPSGALAVYCSQPVGTAHVVLDVTGYFE